MVLIGGILEEDMAKIPMIGRYSIRVLRAIGVFKKPASASAAGKGETK